MLRRLLPAAIGLSVLAAACGQEPIRVTSAEPEGASFFTQVVDFEQDVGAGLALATDADGNPHMAYLAFEQEAEEGEEAEQPAAVVPGAPTLPAVKHAHLVENVWTRTAVAGDLPDLTLEDETAIWVDSEGTHHIAWTENGNLLYTDNPEGGDEAEPQPVTSGSVEGISIAASEDNVPWISFYADGDVTVATLDGKGWTAETVAPAEPATTSIRVAGREPIVAYGDGAATMLARRSGNDWATEAADEAGGIGVAMALDADGNPHLAYYDDAGAVKHAHDVGQGWEVSDVADAGALPQEGSAAIVLDSDGSHHIAWQTPAGIGYASNQEGDFAEEEVARGDGGALPVLGVGPEDAIWLGWMDTEDTEVELALRSEDEPLLALPSPQPTAAGGTAPTAECEPQGTDLAIAAPLGAAGTGFDTDCLAVPAGDAYTIAFDNQDEGQIHNVNVYTDQTASESLLLPPLEGGITGPDSTTYEGDPIDEPGSYFFQCDYHAATMTGTFVVADAEK